MSAFDNLTGVLEAEVARRVNAIMSDDRELTEYERGYLDALVTMAAGGGQGTRRIAQDEARQMGTRPYALWHMAMWEARRAYKS